MSAIIPANLCHPSARFVLVGRGGKQPIEKGWSTSAHYAYSSQKLIEHIAQGGNYGVACGHGGLAVIDCDTAIVEEAVRRDLPPTFTVRTGRGGAHFYFFCPNLGKPIRLAGGNGAGSLGDVKFHGGMVVAPESTHPSGKKYRVETDLPIATVSAEDIRFALRDFLRKEDTPDFSFDGLKSLKITLDELVPKNKLVQRGDEWQGEHPLHGSENGKNFCINPKKGVWHCFRHESGGGLLEWIAVQEGLIDCADARCGALRGEKFQQLLDVLEKKYGYQRPTLEKSVRQDKMALRLRYVWEALSTFVVKTLADTDEIYIYDEKEGIYVLGEAKLTAWVEQKATEEKIDEKITSHFVSEVIAQIKRKTSVERKNLEPDARYIPFANTILDIETDETYEFSPDFFFTHKLGVAYTPSSSCPRFEKFLEEVVAPQDRELIWELIGYVFYRRLFLHKAFLFVGKGRNGKSTLLSLIERLLGKNNCSNVSLHDIENNRFAKAWLFEKYANIYADLSSRELGNTGYFKMVTGEDTIQADVKFGKPFKFVCFAKSIYSCNEIPKAEDETEAFFSRWIMISFPNSFEGRENPHLLSELCEEAEGIAARGVQSLKKLLREKKFSEYETVDQKREKYTRLSDSVAAYVLDNLEGKSGEMVRKDTVYNDFLDYCERHRIPSCSQASFFKRLKKHIIFSQERKLIGGMRIHFLVGISFDRKETGEKYGQRIL